MKPLVFLGSGVSLPAFGDAGSVANLTKTLFEEPWARTTWGEWLPAADIPSQALNQPKCQEFLLRLRTRVEDYYADQRGSLVNYEDLYSLTQQMGDETGWRDNAAVEPFRREIRALCADLCEPRTSIYDNPFESLANETLDFIQNVIATKLRIKVCLKGFALLKALSLLPGLEPLVICTLNHDCLVERFFKAESVDYTDGFPHTAEHGVRYFDRTEFVRENARVKLLKLHGSINWWRLREKGGKLGDDRLGIPVLPLDDCRSITGKRLSKMDSHPSFLTGSNKLEAYQAGIFLAQMREFERALDEHDLIVMSGYGWGDKGINIRLKSWVREKPERRIIVLHKEPGQLRQARPLLWHFDDMCKERKLIPIRKWMCDVDANKLCRCFEKKLSKDS